LWHETNVPKSQKPKLRRKVGGMTVAGLNPEDFEPISKEKFGESLRKAVVKPKSGM